MKWLKRLFNAPMIIRVHWVRSWFEVQVEEAQVRLRNACAVESVSRTPNKKGIKEATDRLEKALESLSDAQVRMSKLWN